MPATRRRLRARAATVPANRCAPNGRTDESCRARREGRQHIASEPRPVEISQAPPTQGKDAAATIRSGQGKRQEQTEVLREDSPVRKSPARRVGRVPPLGAEVMRR